MAHSPTAASAAHLGFGGSNWWVHKFGGTSVANADCFRSVADIVQQQLVEGVHMTPPSLAVVVSAMGGKPKTTDLLLQTVEMAAQRRPDDIAATLQRILDKHARCLQDLTDELDETTIAQLKATIEADLRDVNDVLKTVALMKWRADRIAQIVSGYGELWSAQILAALLNARATAKRSASTSGPLHTFAYLDARRLIVVDEEAIQNGAIDWHQSHDNLNRVHLEEQQRVFGNVPNEDDDDDNNNTTLHYVMTGYVASNTQGVPTTLQRDGSDYSAAILGRLLQANAITIWTDVSGVLTADPRRVPQAQVVSDLSYHEAMELAYFGAKVIHPKTMQPAISAKPKPIPIYIRNTFRPDLRGTRIFSSKTRGGYANLDHVVCGFSSIEGMALVNVEGSGLVGVSGVSRRLFGTLEDKGINVVLISQASSEHTVTFATTEEQAALAKECIEEEFRRELQQTRISTVEVIAPCSIIAAVGDGMRQTTGVSARFFSALGNAKINVLAVAQGSSERNLSAVVHTLESTRALRAVHAAFRLSHTSIRVAVVGMNDLGQSLLQLLEAQRDYLRSTFDLDLHVVAVLPAGQARQLVRLTPENMETGDASVDVAAYNACLGTTNNTAEEKKTIAEAVAIPEHTSALSFLQETLFRSEYSNHVIFDCTNDETVGQYHSSWLMAGIDVVTANNTGLSGPKEQRAEIRKACQAYGKQSAQYLREVTVGGGLPVLSTMRQLLQSGDKIRRIDGILSVSLSFIMFRISPPSNILACSKFDESMGASSEDLINTNTGSDFGQPCSFSQAVKEAIELGLMEEDPTKDLSNEYTARVLMILARELGLDEEFEVWDIQEKSDKVVESILLDSGSIDYKNLPADMDEQFKIRVDAARSRGCVLRHVASIDVGDGSLAVKLLEVPEHHAFAVNPPSCECVRFFTHRHLTYPLTVQGPSAGADSTASALLAELLHLMRGKSSPRSVALTRTDSSAKLTRASVSNNNLHQQVG